MLDLLVVVRPVALLIIIFQCYSSFGKSDPKNVLRDEFQSGGIIHEGSTWIQPWIPVVVAELYDLKAIHIVPRGVSHRATQSNQGA